MTKQPRPLADWLGQPVQFQGFMESWEDVPDRNQRRYLFHPVSVKLYGAGQAESRHIDHLWFYFPGDRQVIENPGLKKRFGSVGIVRQYRRRDGSIDYEIDCTNNLDTDRHIQRYNGFQNQPAEQVRLLERILGAIAEKRCYIPYEFEQRDIDLFAQDTRQRLKVAQYRAEAKERNDALNFAYELSAKLPRHKTSPDPVRFKGRSLQSKGFGLLGNTGNTAKHREN